MIIECLIKSKCSFALAAFRSKVMSNIQFIKWQSLNNCRHDCTQSYDFMYQFQWHAVRLFLLLPRRPFIVSIKSLFANMHNWNIFPLLGKTVACEFNGKVLVGGGCRLLWMKTVYINIYICLHICSFCMNSGDYESKRWINLLSDTLEGKLCSVM